jgi:hypothetical protein
MPIKNVVQIGADGRLGPSVLKELLNANFSVTVLKRQSSTSVSKYPPSVKEIRIPDAFDLDTLAEALKGQDAVIMTTLPKFMDMQKRVALAAAKVGVQRFIPADFGSVDSDSSIARELVPHYYVPKYTFRQYLNELAEQYPTFSWTSLVNGHFFDLSLEFMHIWVKKRTIDYLDDGNIKASASSLGQIGKATAKILVHADKLETKNRLLYTQSFCKTSVELKEALERVTGEQWKAQSHESDAFLKKHMALMKQNNRDPWEEDGPEGAKAREDVVWWLGATDADWTKRDGFAMRLLELEEEDLDEVLKIALSHYE